MPIHYSQKMLLFIAPLLVCSACSLPKHVIDRGCVLHAKKNAALIEALARYSIDYIKEQKVGAFNSDTLHEKEVRAKFTKKRFNGIVTVTFADNRNDLAGGIIDSTVIFTQIATSESEALEITYDFSANAKHYKVDSIPGYGTFREVTERIYYRRRPLGLM